ncbi:MBL fold metallo-hydrolase [Paenibacillus hodogayensis]|uniref:MBL fold metallo-hydrolase n=1 Tax=Paenibacillus hodogayensis TaxID=279208 RepID=A0ABV5W7R2_9BACL
MKLTQAGTLYQLAFMPRLFPVNCYMVEEEEESLTLIDAAMPFSAKAIAETARRIGKPIARIVLTHAHSDHIGALDTLKQMLPEATVYISARDARLLAGDVTLDPGEYTSPIKGGVPKPGQIRTKPDVLLHDGDRIGSLLAVATPGHTPGSMSFVDTRNQSLVVGDAIQVRGGAAVSGQLKPLFPFPALATWSKHTALDSVRKLAELQPSLVAAGHGRMLTAPLDTLRRIIGEAEAAMGPASAERRA